MNLKLTEAQLIAIGKRVAAAFFVAFLSSLIASGFFDLSHITDMAILEKAAFGGIAAVLTLVQSLVSSWLAGEPTVSGSVRKLARRG